MGYSANNHLLSDQWRFLRRLLVNPRRIGAIAPSSPALARAMVAQVDMTGAGSVLELGPGPGAMTNALLARGLPPERLTVIERDPAFVRLIADRYAGIKVLHGDAFDLDRTLADQPAQLFAAVVSGLPLLNFSPEKRAALIESALARLAPGAPFIQFSYGWKKPVAPPPGVTVSHAGFVWRNLPPAHVWVYRRAKQGE